MLATGAMLVRRMLFPWLVLTFGVGPMWVAMSGCADEDPRFGGAGAIRNIEVFDTPSTPAAEGGAGLTPRQAFRQVWTALKAPCAGCHAPPGVARAPLFFGDGEEASYASFKASNYHLEGGKPAGAKDGLVEHGQHDGRPLSDAEKSLVSQWRAAEKADTGDRG